VFDVSPYKELPFDELQAKAEDAVKVTISHYHSNCHDMGLKSFMEVISCFIEPPRFVYEMLEFKMLYAMNYLDASFIADLVEICSYTTCMPRDFYLAMFQHMLAVLERSAIYNVMDCMNTFQRIPEIKELVAEKP
jgi:hypothetical protein